MLVSEFLKLVPGPQALVGAVLESRLPSTGKPVQVMRVTSGESVHTLAKNFGNWHLVERPPLYQNPAARYCAWCKEALYRGYSPKDGLTEGWCPTHGKGAPVLHAAFNPLIENEAFWTPIMDTKPRFRIPKEITDTEYVQKNLFGALGVPKVKPPTASQPITEAQAQLFKRLGFESKEEFQRLAGIR